MSHTHLPTYPSERCPLLPFLKKVSKRAGFAEKVMVLYQLGRALTTNDMMIRTATRDWLFYCHGLMSLGGQRYGKLQIPT